MSGSSLPDPGLSPQQHGTKGSPEDKQPKSQTAKQTNTLIGCSQPYRGKTAQNIRKLWNLMMKRSTMTSVLPMKKHLSMPGVFCFVYSLGVGQKAFNSVLTILVHCGTGIPYILLLHFILFNLTATVINIFFEEERHLKPSCKTRVSSLGAFYLQWTSFFLFCSLSSMGSQFLKVSVINLKESYTVESWTKDGIGLCEYSMNAPHYSACIPIILGTMLVSTSMRIMRNIIYTSTVLSILMCLVTYIMMISQARYDNLMVLTSWMCLDKATMAEWFLYPLPLFSHFWNLVPVGKASDSEETFHFAEKIIRIVYIFKLTLLFFLIVIFPLSIDMDYLTKNYFKRCIKSFFFGPNWVSWVITLITIVATFAGILSGMFFASQTVVTMATDHLIMKFLAWENKYTGRPQFAVVFTFIPCVLLAVFMETKELHKLVSCHVAVFRVVISLLPIIREFDRYWKEKDIIRCYTSDSLLIMKPQRIRRGRFAIVVILFITIFTLLQLALKFEYLHKIPDGPFILLWALIWFTLPFLFILCAGYQTRTIDFIKGLRKNDFICYLSLSMGLMLICLHPPKYLLYFCISTSVGLAIYIFSVIRKEWKADQWEWNINLKASYSA